MEPRTSRVDGSSRNISSLEIWWKSQGDFELRKVSLGVCGSVASSTSSSVPQKIRRNLPSALSSGQSTSL